VTSTGAVPDLTAAADMLGRAAARLEELVEEAPAGPWAVSDANEGSEYPPLWMVTNDAFHNPPSEDEPWLGVEVHTGSRNEAEHIAAFDPHTVAALVPLLRMAAKYALWAIAAGERHRRTFELDDWEAHLLDFARRLLREEETGG
jgi:hypothetical protein